MEGQTRVLQQRVEPAALRRSADDQRVAKIEALKRVRGDQQEGVETKCQRRLGAERGHQRPRLGPPRQDSKQRACHGQYRYPQEHRAFVVPPRPGQLVDERLGHVAVVEHEQDGKVRARERRHQHGEREQSQRALDHGDRAHLAPDLTQHRDHQHELQRRQAGGEPQRRKARFRDHRLSVLPALCSAARLPSWGGM